MWRAQMVAATSLDYFAFEGNLLTESGEATFPIEFSNFEKMPYVVRAMHVFHAARPPELNNQVAWWNVSGAEHEFGKKFRAQFNGKDLFFPHILNPPVTH